MATLLKSCVIQAQEIVNLDLVTHITFDSKNKGIVFYLSASASGAQYVHWRYGNPQQFSDDVSAINKLTTGH